MRRRPKKQQRTTPRRCRAAGKPSSLLTMISDVTASVPEHEWERLPPDLAQNVDHYLYGCKREMPDVRGVEVDAQSRCAHWRSAVDIVAIKMACCGVYWACKDCHEALAGHAIAVWPREEWGARAVLCGACGVEMTIREYMRCESRCLGCGAGFNPGCRGHWRFYFEE